MAVSQINLKLPLKLLREMAELREGLLKVIAEERNAEKVFRSPPVAGARGFNANVVPIVETAVTTAEPGQGSQFRSDRVVGVIFQHRQHGVGAGVRTGIRIGDDILDVKLAGLGEDRGDLF